MKSMLLLLGGAPLIATMACGEGGSGTSGPETSIQALTPATNSFISNHLSNRCIDVAGDPGQANGTPLDLFDCELSGFSASGATTDQQWYITSDGFIRNMLSGRCIDVAGAPGTANGTPLDLANCELSGFSLNGAATDQKWYITSDGFIRNVLSGRCIDVPGDPGMANGTPLDLFDCELSWYSADGNLSDQRWYWR